MVNIPLAIPDGAPRAEYREGDSIVYFYNLYVLWHFIEGVGLKLKWQVVIQNDDREETVGAVVGTNSHTVAEMVPWRQND